MLLSEQLDPSPTRMLTYSTDFSSPSSVLNFLSYFVNFHFFFTDFSMTRLKQTLLYAFEFMLKLLCCVVCDEMTLWTSRRKRRLSVQYINKVYNISCTKKKRRNLQYSDTIALLFGSYQTCSHQSEICIRADGSVHSLYCQIYGYILPNERMAIEHNMREKERSKERSHIYQSSKIPMEDQVKNR